jgi:uroporphyrinogen-III synthase
VKVLVTREQTDGRDTAQSLTAAGFIPVLLPIIGVEVTGKARPAGAFSILIFSSVNGVSAVDWERHQDLLELPVFCVGEKTAGAALAAGFSDVTAGKGTAEQLSEMIKERFGQTGTRALYLCGEVTSFDMSAALEPAAISVASWEVYRIVGRDPGGSSISQALQDVKGGLQFHYSLKSAERFCELLQAHDLEGLAQQSDAVCISEKTAAGLRASCAGTIYVSEEPNERGMIAIALSLNQCSATS